MLVVFVPESVEPLGGWDHAYGLRISENKNLYVVNRPPCSFIKPTCPCIIIPWPSTLLSSFDLKSLTISTYHLQFHPLPHWTNLSFYNCPNCLHFFLVGPPPLQYLPGISTQARPLSSQSKLGSRCTFELTLGDIYCPIAIHPKFLCD
jgi:hypothetical protein